MTTKLLQGLQMHQHLFVIIGMILGCVTLKYVKYRWLFLDAAVQFIWGLSDIDAIINETAELTCKLSSEDCEGAWFRDGKKVSHKGQTYFLLKCGVEPKHVTVT